MRDAARHCDADPALARGVTDNDIERMQKLAVVVSLGDTLHAAFLETTAFQNKGLDVPVPEWEINKLATDTIVETIKSSGKNCRNINK